MAWTNNAQQPPYQYDPHEGGAYLTAIGTGLAIESPISDEAFDGELEAMSTPLAGDNPAPTALMSTTDTAAPPLIIEPSVASSDEGTHQGTYTAQLFGHAESITSSCSSHASGSIDGGSTDGWGDGYSFSDHLHHSPCTTPQSSPYARSDEFDLFDTNGTSRSLAVSSFDFSPNVSSSIGRDSTTPDRGDMDWASTGQPSFHEHNTTIYPSVSVPTTPHMGSVVFGASTGFPVPFAPESNLPQGSGCHLAVPSTTRRYSDPLPPQVSLQPSYSPTWPTYNRDRPRSPTVSSVLGSAQSSHRSAPYTLKGHPSPAPATFPIGKRKGVRTKRLSEETKEQARKVRNERTMCLSCRLSKVKCIGDPDNCVRCATKTVDKGPKVCSRAYFLHHIKAESTSFLLQYQTYAQSSDGSRQLVTLPSEFNVRTFLSKIRDLSQTHNLAVYQSGVLLTAFDLHACDSYLLSLVEGASQTVPFSEFINERMPQTQSKNKGWVRCLKHHPPLDGNLNTWVRWDILPTHMDYMLVSKGDNSQRLLQSDNVQDLETLRLMAQLFAIVTRALELMTYYQLEAQLKKDESVGPDFIQGMGQLLLLLRWRVAWWKRLGNRIPCSDMSVLLQRDASIKSARQLCLCLYMYYCYYRRSRLQMDDLYGYNLGGQNSRYPNATKTVTERFPRQESLEGFEMWMEEGEASFEESGSLQDLMMFY